MKKSLAITIIMILIIGMFGGFVNAASAGVSASSKVTKSGDTVTVTVSFGGQKVKAAQFTLGYDSSALQYVSYSCVGSGTSNFVGNKFGYYGAQTADVSSVSFTFKAKSTATNNVSASNFKMSTATESSASTSKCGISVSVKSQDTSNNTGGSSNNGGTSNGGTSSSGGSTTNKGSSNKKPTNKKPSTNNNKKDDQTTTEEPVEEEKQEETEEEQPTEPAPKQVIELDDKDATTLEDEETDVVVKALPIAVVEGAVLEVKIVREGDKNYEELAEILKDLEGNKTYFNIRLLKDDVEIQPNGYVTVYLPIPETYDKERVKLYYINEQSGSYERQEKRIEDNYFVFTTDHFSTYVLVEEPAPKTLSDTLTEIFTNYTVLYVIMAVLGVAVIAETVIIIKNACSKGRE